MSRGSRFGVALLSLSVSIFATGGHRDGPTTASGSESDPAYAAFRDPMPVSIRGYDGDAMEPFVSRDGHYLFFNDRNDPQLNTDLHYAARIDDLTFGYKGKIAGVNSPDLDGVPSMDSAGDFYFVSTRSYRSSLSTIYRGKWSGGSIGGADVVPGISLQQMGAVNFDAEISADGRTLYFVDGTFRSGEVPRTADIVFAERAGPAFARSTRSTEILGNVNTDMLEYAPSVSADGLELFFTRLDPSRRSPRVFRSARRSPDQAFGPPQPVAAITGFAEAPTLSPDGRALYFHRKDGDRFVIYRVTR
jgi:WD40-like Beta Propeller Repeat